MLLTTTTVYCSNKTLTMLSACSKLVVLPPPLVVPSPCGRFATVGLDFPFPSPSSSPESGSSSVLPSSPAGPAAVSPSSPSSPASPHAVPSASSQASDPQSASTETDDMRLGHQQSSHSPAEASTSSPATDQAGSSSRPAARSSPATNSPVSNTSATNGPATRGHASSSSPDCNSPSTNSPAIGSSRRVAAAPVGDPSLPKLTPQQLEECIRVSKAASSDNNRESPRRPAKFRSDQGPDEAATPSQHASSGQFGTASGQSGAASQSSGAFPRQSGAAPDQYGSAAEGANSSSPQPEVEVEFIVNMEALTKEELEEVCSALQTLSRLKPPMPQHMDPYYYKVIFHADGLHSARLQLQL